MNRKTSARKRPIVPANVMMSHLVPWYMPQEEGTKSRCRLTTTITIPYNNGITTTASWSPSSTQFKVGELSNLTVGLRNTSNGLATSLTLALPTDPTAAGNLFDTVDLSGIGAVVFPTGADQIQVDAYVAGAWVTGTPAPTAAPRRA